MKKMVLVALVLSLAPISSFAEETIGGDAEDAKTAVMIGTEVFRPSNNVQIIVESSASDYAAVSGHLQGTVQYGTTSRQNAIFEGTKTAGNYTSITAPTSALNLDTSVFAKFISVDEDSEE